MSTGGTTTVYPGGVRLPVVPEEPAIEGDVNGSTGTFYTETSVTEKVVEVEMIGGLPSRIEVEVLGFSANRRMMRGKSGEKIVNVERRGDVKPGSKGWAKLVIGGSAPLYRMVG